MSGVRKGEREALVAFFLATNGATAGPGWHEEGWNSTTPVSDWHGVTVDSETITRLELEAVELMRGPIPPQLGDLKSLQVLQLESNKLSGPIPPQLGDLKSLQKLGLNKNQLSGPIPPQLGDLKSLEVLYLHNNQLSGPIPPQLGDLKSLQELNLGWNKLSGPIPPQLGDLKSLQLLWLFKNQLSGPIPPQLGDLKSLQQLYLGTNQLSGPIPPQLGDLKSLQQLYLGTNQLSGPIPPQLGDLKSLQELYLFTNELSGPIPPQLGDLKSLQKLGLSSNQLSGPIPPQLGDLKSLQLLWLFKNQLSGPVPAQLGDLKSLQVLYLYNNQLSEYPALAAEKIDRLQGKGCSVSAYDNPWSRPPGHVMAQGTDAIMAWWRDIEASGSVKSSKLKVVLVGAGTAGKTSLTRALTGKGEKLPTEKERTIGVERRKTVRVADCFKRHCLVGGVETYLEGLPAEEEARAAIRATSQDLNLVMWDFAGQEAYFSHHQTFLTAHALFVLVVDLPAFLERDSEARDAAVHQEAHDADFAHEQEISLWLSVLDMRVKDCHVVVVATKTHGMTDEKKAYGKQRLTAAVMAAATRLNRRRDEFATKTKRMQDSRPRSQQEQQEQQQQQQQQLEGDLQDEKGSPIVADKVTSTGVTVLTCADGEQVPVLVDSKEKCGVGEVLLHLTRAVHDKKTAFPSVDASIPKSWDEAMDFLVGQSVTRSFVEWSKVVQEWKELKEEEGASGSVEKESPMFTKVEATKEGGGASEEILRQAAHLLERQGTMLFTNEGKVLHLKPERIIDLLKPIADHRITTEGRVFWKPRIENYLLETSQYRSSGTTEEVWQELIKLRDFGIVHERVLEFLWLSWTPIDGKDTSSRRQLEKQEKEQDEKKVTRTFLSDLRGQDPDARSRRELMRGMLVESGALYTAQHSDTEESLYWVPSLLETWVDKGQLKDAFYLSTGQKMSRCAIVLPGQPFVPPGLMPRIVAACMRKAKSDASDTGSCEVDLCWRYGVVLYWGDQRVLVYHSKGNSTANDSGTNTISLNNTHRKSIHEGKKRKLGVSSSEDGEEEGGEAGGAVVEWCVLGDKASHCDRKARQVVRPCILDVLERDFPGLDFTEALPGMVKCNMKAALHSLEQHMDTRMDVIEKKVCKIVEATRGIESFIHLSRTKDMPYPALAVLLPEGHRMLSDGGFAGAGEGKNTPAAGGGSHQKGLGLFQKGAWEWAKGKAVSTVARKYRLFFLCSHDLSLVPTGPDGKGYEVPMPKQWLKRAAPLLKLSLLALKVAAKCAVGIDLPIDGVFDALSESTVETVSGGVEEGIDLFFEEADPLVEEFMREECRATHATLEEEDDGGDQEEKDEKLRRPFSRKDVDFGHAYKAYLAFLEAKAAQLSDTHHKTHMVLLEGGTEDSWAWVRKANAEEWKETHDGTGTRAQSEDSGGGAVAPSAHNGAADSVVVGGGGGDVGTASGASPPSPAPAPLQKPSASVGHEQAGTGTRGALTAEAEGDSEGQDIRRWLQEVSFNPKRLDAVVDLLVDNCCDSLKTLDSLGDASVEGLLLEGVVEKVVVESFMFYHRQRKSNSRGFFKRIFGGGGGGAGGKKVVAAA